jgi:hypothetical protein
VACLYCGKEIGPIRLLRDSEFCSPNHRKQYKDRLKKVLIQVGEPETVPTHIAPFRDTLRPHTGPFYKTVASFDFSTAKHRTRFPSEWPVALAEPAAGAFALLAFAEEDRVPEARPAEFEPTPAPYVPAHAETNGSLPAAELGSVVLRSVDGQLLSAPAALQFPEPKIHSLQPETPALLPLAQHGVGLALPGLALSATECEELRAAAEPPNWDRWMRPAIPEPVSSNVQPRAIGALPLATARHLPALLTAKTATLKPERHESFIYATAQPRNLDAKPIALASAITSIAAAAPALPQFEMAAVAMAGAYTQCVPVPASQPAVCEVRPVVHSTPAAVAAVPVRFAPFAVKPVRDPVPDELVETLVAEPPRRAAAAAKMASASPVNSAPATLARATERPAAAVALPSAAAERQQTEVPQADLIAVDYRCPGGPVVPRPVLSWASRPAALHMPRFAVRPVFDRLEEQSRPKPERKKAAFAEIFTMPDAAAMTQRKAARHAFTAIAASVTVAMALWFGASAGQFGKDLLRRQAEELAAAPRIHSGSTGTEVVSAPATPPNALHSPVAWIRSEAAKRATVQLADTFDNGMSAWGSKAQGWGRSADGYIRPSQLALFQPTLNFTDYRMEFFGQIESKSMSWAVRGKDPENYYAMKFHVVEAGLRPVIAMAHYPVVGGKQGHKVEVPLSVMVHNNTPYHVSVEVRGSHYTASIEGQEVDSWSDDTLLAGGVGFFSEAGARARIYWMRVSKNDDWFGRLCGAVAGGLGSRETASLQRPALPVPTPNQPVPPPAAEAALQAETAESGFASLQRGKGSWKGEMDKWS